MQNTPLTLGCDLIDIGRSRQCYTRHYLWFQASFFEQSALEIEGLPATRLKTDERVFLFAGPSPCNSLPQSLQDIRDSQVFKRNLKAVLCDRAYSLGF